MNRAIFLLLNLWLLFLSGAPARADLALGAGSAPVSLAGHLHELRGADHARIDAVAAGQAGAFVPLPGNFMGGFGTERSVWLRFTLVSHTAEPTSWRLRVLPTYLDHIDLYQSTEQGWVRTAGGDTRPFSDRAFDDRATVFALTLPPNEPRTFYLHLRHAGAFNAYPVLYPPATYQRLLTQEGLIFGLYFGVALLLLLINWVHWITLRELIFLEFGVYLAVRGLYFLCYDGLAYQWVLPNDPAFLHSALRFLLAWAVATIAPILVRVLDMRRQYPRLARLTWILGGLAGLISLTVFTGQFAQFGKVLSLIVLLLGLIGGSVALMQLRQNRPLGWLILAAMLTMLFGLASSSLAAFGISSGLFLDVYGGQVASFATFLALHFAVTQRVLEIKREQLASERTARLATELAERERSARQEQSDFVAMLFHEIKTPLAEIASATTVLEQLDDGAHRETGARYDTIHRAVERLNLMVEQNLARDRQGLEDIHLARRPIDPVALARVVLDSFRNAHQHELLLDAPHPLPTLSGDPEFLRVALANLVDNAIKYTPPHSTIRVILRAQAGALHITVRDTGPGMNDEAAARAFDRYWRGDGAGSIGGAGLGLYLVRRIAEAHGGTATVASQPGQGCRFTLSFPLNFPESPAPSPKPA